MDLSANVYSTSTIAAAAACLGAVLVGVYVVWGPDFFFRKKGALASSIIVCCTIVNIPTMIYLKLEVIAWLSHQCRPVSWFDQSRKYLFHECRLAGEPGL